MGILASGRDNELRTKPNVPETERIMSYRYRYCVQLPGYYQYILDIKRVSVYEGWVRAMSPARL
jgi:hypothetical protein